MAHGRGAQIVRLDASALARVGALRAVLALDPSSWGGVVTLGDAAPLTLRRPPRLAASMPGTPGMPADGDEPSDTDDGDEYVAIVQVRGPLMQRAAEDLCGYVDGYDAVAARFAAALADPGCVAVLLAIDSPGGMTSGLEEAAARMRAASAASGKPVVAYVDELAASAAYLLATVADRIIVPPSGGVGSIGTFTVHIDESAANEKQGLAVTLIQDPPGKTAGNSAEPLDDVGRARLEARVQDTTARFIAAVAEARDLSAAFVRGLDGAVRYGADAVTSGLADEVGSLESAIQFAASAAQQKRNTMTIRSALASLVKAPSDASDEQLERSAQAALPLVDLGRAVLALTGAKSADGAAAIVAAWQTASARTAQLEAEAASRDEEKSKKKRVKAVQALVAAGRLTPAEAKKDPAGEVAFDNLAEPWTTMDLGVLRGMADRLAPAEQIAAGESKAGSAPRAPAIAPAMLTPEERHYAKVLRIDEASLAAHKAEEQRRARESLREEVAS